MDRMFRVAWLVIREAMNTPTLRREPEPSGQMSDARSVCGFHEAGNPSGPLLGVYHFNARRMHALTPRGGTVLDLGCGSGQCLAYLARRRPDLRLIGLDLSPQMVDVGNRMLRASRLSDRVELHVGDMTSFAANIPDRVDLISSIFSLHHLPGHSALHACAGEIAAARRLKRSSIWIFDHARPRRESTARRFPEVFTPDASTAFKMDSYNSLKAAWSFDELKGALRAAFDHTPTSSLARMLRLYQVHWMEECPATVDEDLWQAPRDLPVSASKNAEALARLFRSLPA